MDIRKALDLSSSAASYLLPKQTVDGAIRDYASKVPAMYNAVNRRPWATQTYYIKKKLTLPSASWSTDGGPLPAATQSTFGEAFKTVKYLYTRGEVTGPMIAAAGSVFDALAMDIEDHQAAIVQKLSSDIITANGSANDITGILYQIETDTSMAGPNTPSAVYNAGGTALSLAHLDAAIDATEGATAIVATKPVRRKINSLLQAQQRYLTSEEIQAGFRVSTYDGLPIFTDPQWQDNTRILIFDRNKANLLVHHDFEYEELAKTKDSVDYFIKGYFGFSLEGSAVLMTNFAAV
jgi:HK97 family phage major capsid protein